MIQPPPTAAPFRLAVLSEDGVDEPQGADLTRLLEQLAAAAAASEEADR